VEPANFNLGTCFSSLQRLALVYSSVRVYTLLMRIARAAYERALRLTTTNSATVPTAKMTKQKITTTVRERMLSSSSDLEIDEEEEEESLLGRWMQNLLRPSDAWTGSAGVPEEKSIDSVSEQQQQEVVRHQEQEEGEEPQAYLLLASLILNWLAAQPTNSAEEGAAGLLADYMTDSLKASRSPTLVCLLGGLIRDMDENAAAGSRQSLLAGRHANAWSEFSASLNHVTERLMGGPLAAAGPLSVRLLEILGLDPEGGEGEEGQPWPLFVPRRRLAVLARVLLRRQAVDTDMYSTRVTGLYIRLWERTVSRLMQLAATADDDDEDINVEHVQLLLMLFHALQLLQKKQVLLHTANQLLCLCGGREGLGRHTLVVGRLALLLDYMMRHLYEPPAALLDQLQANLFRSPGGGTTGRPAYFPSPDHPEEDPDRPRYYLLSPLAPGAAAAAAHSMDVPKLDGLAVSFLLTSPELLDYARLYEALVSSLDTVYAASGGGRHRRTVSYSFSVVWRLLHSLPPPAAFLSRLVDAATSASASRESPLTEEEEEMSPQGVPQEKLGYGVSLHAMVLGTRAANKGFATWMREGLTKQGLLLGKAEVLVKAVATDVNSISFEMRQLQNFLLALEDRFHGPPLSGSGATVVDLDLADLLLLDCLLAKFQMSLDRVFFASSKLTSSPGLHAVESLGLSDMEALKAGLEKTRLKKKKNQTSGFFWFFFGFFFGFFGFFCPEERVFRFFFQFQEYV
jgi:E3 ubiquitin-protein ligase UBR4